MNVNRIHHNPSQSEKHTKLDPHTKKQIEKIQEVEETDPDIQKKPKWVLQEEEEGSSSTNVTEKYKNKPVHKKTAAPFFDVPKKPFHPRPSSIQTPQVDKTPSSLPDNPAFWAQQPADWLLTKEKEEETTSVDAKKKVSSNPSNAETFSSKKEKTLPKKPATTKPSSQEKPQIQTEQPFHQKPKSLQQTKKHYRHASALAEEFSGLRILKKKDAFVKKDPKKNPQQPLQPIPTHVIAEAAVTTTQISRSIPPEMHNLFTQMVSTIMVMTQSGITTTEVTLHSSVFQNSPFQGATITIEQYASAPDSFNIRLSGNNEAVSLFQQNLENLQGAFQSARLPFRIGRIEAVYQTVKTLYRKRRGSKHTEEELYEKGEDSLL